MAYCLLMEAKPLCCPVEWMSEWVSVTIENEQPTNSADFVPIPIFPDLSFCLFWNIVGCLTSVDDCFKWPGISLWSSTWSHEKSHLERPGISITISTGLFSSGTLPPALNRWKRFKMASNTVKQQRIREESKTSQFYSQNIKF